MKRRRPALRLPSLARASRRAAPVWLLGLLVALAPACGGRPAAEAEHAAAAPAAPARPAVTVAAVSARPIERTIGFVGTLNAASRAEVAAEADGRLLTVDVELGDAVAEGQVLATIERSALEARLREAEAVLARAEAEAKRARALRAKGVTSQQKLEDLESAAAVARARREVLAIELGHTQIRAPFAGRIAKRLVDVGNFVRRGTPLFVVVADDPLRLRAQVPERYAAEIAIGKEIRGGVAAYPDRVVRGRITHVSAAADPDSRSLTVEAEVPNPDGRLRPGFFCKGDILVRRSAEALVVPAEAVLDFAGVSRVFVVDDDGVVHRREVETGVRLGDAVEIRRGLRAGERVATSGLGRLVDGAEVEPRLARDGAAAEARS